GADAARIRRGARRRAARHPGKRPCERAAHLRRRGRVARDAARQHHPHDGRRTRAARRLDPCRSEDLMAATLTTHVLDPARGLPAAGVSVGVFALAGGERKLLGVAVTNADGRTDAPLATGLAPGHYELVFAVMDYFTRDGVATFFDEIPVRFVITAGAASYHVPLLLSPWS